MRTVRKSLRLRLLTGAALWIATALLVAGLAIASLLRDFVEQSFDERLTTNLVAVISAVQFDADRTLVSEGMATEPTFSQPLSGWYWQIADGRTVVLRSPSLWDGDFGVETGSVGTRGALQGLVGPSGEALRAVFRDFTAPGGGGAMRVIVAGPAAEIEQAVDGVTTPLLLSLAILGLGLILAVLIQTTLGLKPLATLQRGLADVRSGRLQAVPDAGYAELEPVIGELNGLLSHNRAVIERARTHVGNLAHGLKTPLAILANEASRPGRDPEGAMGGSIGQMERLVGHHLRRARQAASRDVLGTATPLGEVLADLAAIMGKIHAERDLRIDLDVEPGLVFAGERHDLEEMCGNLIDNACKWAASHVAVKAHGEAGLVVIRFADDGPGLTEDQRQTALSRGTRIDETAPGSGLGLSIVVDLAQLYGGRLDLGAAAEGGLEARLSLPSLPSVSRV